MGMWGLSLFENDFACDVKDSYMRILQQQFSDEEAYNVIFEEFRDVLGTDEEPLFWLALAHVQWSVGRLIPEVRERATEWLHADYGNDTRSEEKLDASKWNDMLKQLESMLESPMPPRKKIKRPPDIIRNPWNIGDVYAYQCHTKMAESKNMLGKYVIFQKIGETEYCQNTVSVVQIYDGVFDIIPQISSINNLRVLPLIYPPGTKGTPEKICDYAPSFQWYLKAYMILDRKNDYPRKFMTFIGNQSVKNPFMNDFRCADFWWEKDGMEDWLCEYMSYWKNVEYVL